MKPIKRGDFLAKKLKENYFVVKQNALNEMRTNNMTLQELRFFSVYLSKINPKDISTRLVRFPMADFQAIMDLNQKNINYFQKVAESLLNKPMKVPTGRGGFEMFQLFQVFIIDPDENGDWYVEIDVNDRALPLMFDFQSRYFKYELWNALRLRSRNQIRIYEILKQHEKIGYRIIAISDLKEMLGMSANEYPLYNDFKRYVLDACQKALLENTDISFTYETHSKKERRTNELKFTITKNKGFQDPLQLDEFIEIYKGIINDITAENEIDFDDIDENGIVRATGRHWKYEERITALIDACFGEFSREEIIVLLDRMPVSMAHDENKSFDYLQSKYREMDMRKPEKSRFGYLKKLIIEG